MKNFALTFCIPTYRRPELLLKAIESIIVASNNNVEDIQVVIADDSTDNTNQWVIDKINDKFRNLKYVKNDINLGIDGNILHSVDVSDGEFIWIIGEDDLVCPDAVKNFLNLNNRSNYGFICSNYSYIDSSQSRIIKRDVMGISENKSIHALELLEDHSWSFGFIGACIINKKAWQSVDSSKYNGTFFAHVGTILEAVKDMEILITSKPSVLNRCGDSEVTSWGKDSTFEVINGWADLMDRLESIYPKNSCLKSCKKFEGRLGANSLAFLFLKRADGVYTRGVYDKYYKFSSKGFFYRLFALMILLLSPDFCKLVRSIKRIPRSLVHSYKTDKG